jgi:hypothetical protein
MGLSWILTNSATNEYATFNMHAAWKTWLLVGGVLVATHLVSAAYYYERYACGEVTEGPAGILTLDLSPREWIRTSCVRDPAAYLRASLNVAAGEGMTIRVPGSNPPRTEPFSYWGPGAPFVFGWWLWLFGDGTMWPLFWFAVLSQLAFGAITVATAALWTRSTTALALTAFFTGCCPPLQNWYYSSNLTLSELVALVPMSVAIFALSKALIALRAVRPANPQSAYDGAVWAWFAAAGVLIGVGSLIRDSGQVFTFFVAGFVVARAVAFDRRRFVLAMAAALVMMTGTQAVRFPIERWNQTRIGLPVVSTSDAMAIWRYGLWLPPNQKGIHDFVAGMSADLSPAATEWFENDLYRWCVAAGFGFGHSLDAEAAERVEDRYRAGAAHPALYSLVQFAKAAATHPVEAIEFKAKRLPVLWLGAGMWPDVRLGVSTVWCFAAYGCLIAYIAVQRRRRRLIPEPVYLYALLVFMAMPLIHFEFRYTFPIWNSLVMVPGLLFSALRNCDRVIGEQKESDTGCPALN